MVRDTQLPVVFAQIELGLPHVFRLETYSDTLYVWYVDGIIIDQGTPEGVFPAGIDPVVSFRAKFHDSPSTTKWHYARWGDMPGDGSLDFNSDAQVDDFEAPFFAECMLGPGIDAGPGCRWADFDADTDVDCADRDAFIAAWTGANDSPSLIACLGPPAPIPAVSQWGVVITTILMLAAGSLVFARSRRSRMKLAAVNPAQRA